MKYKKSSTCICDRRVGRSGSHTPVVLAFFQRLRIILEILVSGKFPLLRSSPVWEFDIHLSNHLPLGITDHVTVEKRLDVYDFISRFEFCPRFCPRTNYLLSKLFHTSKMIDDSMLSNWGTKWTSAHTTLEQISFRFWSHNGFDSRAADLLTLSIEEFVSDSMYFALDRMSFVCWGLKALLVSLVNAEHTSQSYTFALLFSG